MPEWQILKIAKTHNKQLIKQALHSLLSSANFAKDIEQVFTYIEAYKTAIEKIESSASEPIIQFPKATAAAIANYNNKGETDEFAETLTPEALIAKLSEIYSNPKLRFNYFAWTSAIAALVNDKDLDLSDYKLPIIDFISSHPYLKTDVLRELYKGFWLSYIIQGEEWDEICNANPTYRFGAALLQGGNLRFDLFIESIDPAAYSLDAIDFIFSRLRHSLHECSTGQYPQAYNLLAEIPPEISPLALTQRKLNILNIAINATDDSTVKNEIFPNELSRALAEHPQDSHLLFLKANYIFCHGKPESIAPHLIDILKADPLNIKVFYLLGKQYLKENLIYEANIIFQRLTELEPRNIQFSAYAAKAARIKINNKLHGMAIKRNYDFYISFIFELIDLDLYEEIEELEHHLGNDDSYLAIFLYAKHREAIKYKKDVKNYLPSALAAAKDPLLILKIKKEMLSSISDWHAHGDFIKSCYSEFPDDDMVNYCMGEYVFFVENDYSRAMLHFDKVIEVNPKFINVYFTRGRTADILHRYGEAADNMSTYVTSVTHYPPAYRILGKACFELSQFYRSYYFYKKAIALTGVNDNSAEVQHGLMHALYLGYQNATSENIFYYRDIILKEGLELFDSLNKKDLYKSHTSGISAFFWAAKACESTSGYARGLAYCDCALDIFRLAQIENIPHDFIELRTDLLSYLDKYQDIVDFFLPLTVRPTDPARGIAYTNLSLAYRELHSPDKAYKFCLDALAFYAGKEDADWYWLEGWIFSSFNWFMEQDLQEQSTELAEYYIEHITTPDAGHIRIYAFLAGEYHRHGFIEDACKHYQKTLEFSELFPDYFIEHLEQAKAYLGTHAKELEK